MMRTLTAVIACVLLGTTVLASAQSGRADSDEQFDLLERQIRSVKKDLLDLESDMLRIERDVRFPENQRWTLYVTGPAIDQGRLYSIVVSINGAVVASHTYSEIESRALTQGGAHQLYTGSLEAGSYNVTIQARDHLGERIAAYQVDKGAGPQILNLQWTAAPGSQPFRAETLADRG